MCFCLIFFGNSRLFIVLNNINSVLGMIEIRPVAPFERIVHLCVLFIDSPAFVFSFMSFLGNCFLILICVIVVLARLCTFVLCDVVETHGKVHVTSICTCVYGVFIKSIFFSFTEQYKLDSSLCI